jgi:hypothetical protein
MKFNGIDWRDDGGAAEILFLGTGFGAGVLYYIIKG